MDNYYDNIAEGYDGLHAEEQKKKLDMIKKHMKIYQTDKLLDVGCGTGLSSDFGCKVTGVDPSEGLVRIANEKGINVIQASAEDLPFDDGSFDVVVSVTAAQNFDDMEKALREIKRVGKRRFAISILKKSSKLMKFRQMMASLFPGAKLIEEEKDIIAVISI